MGRPLKIAKATLITLTGTSSSTDLVTVSEDISVETGLAIVPGTPFTPNSNIGNLVAGTVYYVLNVVSAYTFSVSETELSTNINSTPFQLGNSSTPTTLTVGYAIDTGFQNPDTAQQSGNTSTNPGASYGVVGGNTAIYGSQVLANVCIGVNGTGTVFASTSSNNVVGLGTDFANVATGSHLYTIWGDGSVKLLGTTTSTKGDLTVVVANTSSTGNIIGTTGNAQTLVENTPVTFSANIGNLFTGTTYWVKNIANADAFTVSSIPGGAEVALDDDTGTPNAVQNHIVLASNSANNASGPTGYGDPFIQALPEAGYIIRQKGKTKYLVQGTVTGLTAQCYLANVANTALTPNTMSVIATFSGPSTKYVQSLENYQSRVFPTQTAAASLISGTVYTIYSTGTTDWTAVGSASNMTGVTFTATGAGSGTGTAILANANPDVISTFGTAYAANTYGGQPNPIVTINNA